MGTTLIKSGILNCGDLQNLSNGQAHKFNKRKITPAIFNILVTIAVQI